MVIPQSINNVVKDANQQQIVDVFNGINAFRASKGLAPVKFSVPISVISQRWSDRMAATDTFYHNPDYVTGSPNGWTGASEIIAARWDRSGQGLVNQWIASPGHNAIMSDPQYNTMGIGVAFTDLSTPEDPSATRYGTYGTANLFRYDRIPAGTYNSPADYFAGLPPLTETSNVTNVVPMPPDFNVQLREYTIHDMVGVQYKVNGVPVPTGTYSVSPDSDIRITVQAVPETGYSIPSTVQSTWSTMFAKVVTPVTVTPLSPSFSTAPRTYTIPSQNGVQYTVNGEVKPSGTYPGVGLTSIKATATTGYVLSGTTSWSFTFAVPVPTVTPVAPVFNLTTRTYTIPSQTGVQYSVNGAIKAAGTYPATGIVNVTAAASPGYILSGTTSWTVTIPVPLSYAIKSSDLVAVDGAGALWNYGPSASKTRKALASSGWGSTKKLFVTDWNSDGVQDIVAQTTAGSITVSYGTKTGTLMAPKVIGTGWSTYDISVAKYAKLDKFPTIIARDSAGNLWQYSNPTGAGIGSRIQKGSGWGGLQISLLDWDKDGNMDIIAKTSTGTLKLYRTDGAGRFISETRKIIGTGWSGFQISSVSGYSGAGTQGVLAKDNAGNLYYYGTGKASWFARMFIGGGWTPMKIASS
jgi:hypothetical protein